MAAVRDVDFTTTSVPPQTECADKELWTPLLTQYDAYHGATYCLNGHLAPLASAKKDSQTASRHAKQGPPSIKADYQDFSAELTGLEDGNTRCLETFTDVLKKANDWLKQNPQIDIRTCETLTWSTIRPMEVGDTETLVFERCLRPKTEADTYYYMGLRLWLIPPKEGSSALESPRRLAIRDCKAREKESLSHLVKRVNNNLEEDPIAGNIISSETLLVPNFPSWDTTRLLWRQSQCHQGRYNTFIRLFYVEGTPRMESLGIKQMVPEVVHGTHESFSLLMRRASRWISTETTIHVTNLKSVHLSKDNDSPLESADKCGHYFREFGSQQYFQVLRVFYVQRPIAGLRKHHVINCMTFTPVQTSLGPNVIATFEKMKHTMVRISAWLQLSGAEVFSLESFATPLIPTAPNHTLPEVTYWTPTMTSLEGISRKYLFHIRIYIDGDFIDPDPQLLPPLPYSLTLALRSSIQQREVKQYYRKKKRRRRRKRIMIIIAVIIIAIVGGIILLDQAFNLFHLPPQ